MNFRFLASAQAELLETISYYSAINGALGLRFEQAVANAVRGARSSSRARRSRIKEYTPLVGEGVPVWCHLPGERARSLGCRSSAPEKTARVLVAPSVTPT